MAQNRQTIGNCPKCRGNQFTCSYNHFQSEDLTIDSWEHKCLDCGFRETEAFRSDAEEPIPDDLDVKVCPYCGRHPG